MEPVIILIAFGAGLVFRKLGYPPLLGYLLAGFIAHELGVGNIDHIAPIADFGILLLLFTIGLKLNLKEMVAPQVWGVASLHMAIAVVLTVPVILLAGYLMPSIPLPDSKSAWALAFALSFSSTVFAVKIFDERGEGASLHASIAIGILIIQDLMAVGYLVFTSDESVHVSAVVLLALPLLRPLLLKLLKFSGHGELLVLFGVAATIGASELFELFHLKGGLGAFVFGVLLGSTVKSNELYKQLINLKDLFLIGFFLQIGFYGFPPTEMLIVVVSLALLIFLRPIIYFFLLVAFKLRARTALLAGMSLFNYSEFGLIVAAIAVSNGMLAEEWLTTLALAMAISFFIATPFNTRIHSIFSRVFEWLHKFERKSRLPDERIQDLGDAQVVVLGMGRVGYGVYKYLEETYADKIVGVEENIVKAEKLAKDGLNCIHGDASDYEFWRQTKLTEREIIFVSLSNHRENLYVVNLARQFGYQNKLAVISRFPDEKKELDDLGCITFNLYAEAGHGFAEHVVNQIATTKS